MSDYVRGLREKVGHDLLLLPSTHCVIRDDADRILLVRNLEGRWMLPGGAIDPGETPADAARRECWEEAGILVEPERILGVYGGPELAITYANGSRAMYVVTIFAARLLDGEPRPDHDETEAVGWFAEHEIPESARGHILRRVLAGIAFDETSWTP